MYGSCRMSYVDLPGGSESTIEGGVDLMFVWCLYGI